MSETVNDLSAETLREMFHEGGRPYRVIPAFAGIGELPDTRALLASLLDDPAPRFTYYPRDEGVVELRVMAAIDSRCADFAAAADLLAATVPETTLALGWTPA